MKVGIVAKKNRSFRCFFCHFFLRRILLLQHLSRRFQLFFFNHFDQFSRVVLDWQLSISPTCSSLLGYTIHSLTIYSHACSTPPQQAQAIASQLPKQGLQVWEGIRTSFVRRVCCGSSRLAGASVYALRDQKSLVFGQLPCVSQ